MFFVGGGGAGDRERTEEEEEDTMEEGTQLSRMGKTKGARLSSIIIVIDQPSPPATPLSHPALPLSLP